MLMKSTRARPVAGRIVAAALIAAGLSASASYGYAADKKDKTDDAKAEKIVEVKRMIFVGDGENEVIHNDMAVGDRVRVLEFEGENGQRRVIRIENGEKTVRVFDKDGNLVSEDVGSVGDGENTLGAKSFVLVGRKRDIDIDADGVSVDGEKKIKIVTKKVDGEGTNVVFVGKNADAQDGLFAANCVLGEGEGSPRLLEFREEGSEGGENLVSHSIVCAKGDEAGDPAKTAEALRKAIDKMEADAARDAERRARMIAGLREQLKTFEQKEKAEKKKKK